jgi:hypothetical protein
MPNPDGVRDPKQPFRGIDLTTPEAEASVQEGTHKHFTVLWSVCRIIGLSIVFFFVMV